MRIRTTVMAPIIVATLIALPLGVLPAQADSAGIDEVVSPQTTITYNLPVELPMVIFQQNRGESSEEGCTFEISGVRDSSSDVVEIIHEVSFDPSSCTQVIARAKYPRGDVPESVRQLLEQYGIERLASSPMEIVPQAALVTYNVTVKAMTKDIVNLTTTSTQTSLTWQSTGNEVLGFSSTHDYSSISITGWERYSHTESKARLSSSSVYADTTARYRNYTFCTVVAQGGPTYADHTRTRFEGRANGSGSWSTVLNKYGGCSSWLTTVIVVN
jgi:hypothetical protein